MSVATGLLVVHEGVVAGHVVLDTGATLDLDGLVSHSVDSRPPLDSAETARDAAAESDVTYNRARAAVRGIRERS